MAKAMQKDGHGIEQFSLDQNEMIHQMLSCSSDISLQANGALLP